MKEEKHNTRFIMIVTVIFIVSGLISNYLWSYSPIIDATVEEESGKISFAYRGRNQDLLIIETCDSNGISLKTKIYDSPNGSAKIKYIDSHLFIYVYGIHLLEEYDENGNWISSTYENEMSHTSAIVESHCWNEWKEKGNVKTYFNEQFSYCYREPSFFQKMFHKGECTLTLTTSNGEEHRLYSE